MLNCNRILTNFVKFIIKYCKNFTKISVICTYTKVHLNKKRNSILRAQAHNEGYCVTSDNARRTSKPRRSRGVGEAQSRYSRCVVETQLREIRDEAETKPRRSRGAISPASIVASLVISRIVCIDTYSILCDFGADTSFYAETRI